VKAPSSATAEKRSAVRSAATEPIAAEAPPPSADDLFVPLDGEGLKRVSDIIRNARATWFALLGALVFAAITLASVKDVSFFVSTVETKLPFVDISVPVTSFFWAGSLLIAAIYAYFHLYLELLWQALGDAPARIDGKPLADRIDPWIVADSALRLRDRLRGAHGEERASRQRAMQIVSDIVSVGLVWVFGLVVIFWFWWRSMPAHEPLLTGFIGVVLAGTLWVFCVSLVGAFSNLAERQATRRWKDVFVSALMLIAIFTTVRTWIDPWQDLPRFQAFAIGPQAESWLRALESYRPARANLREVVFTEKPKDWQGKEIAETEFRVRWCKERGEPKCPNPLAVENRPFADKEEEKAFQATWKKRWAAQLSAFPKPDLRRADFRFADVASAQLEGADLRLTKLEGANLMGANIEGANLSNSNLRGADLRGANIEGADLTRASLEGANLVGAKLEGTVLFATVLEGANFRNTDLKGVFLEYARLRRADLKGARLEGAVLTGANMEGADLRSAILNGADLTRASLNDANLLGASFDGAVLRDASLKGANIEGADLSGADLSGANFSRATLKRSILSLTNLKGANLGFAKLKDTDLSSAILNGAHFTAAHLDSVSIRGATFEGTDFSYARLSGSPQVPLDFTKAKFNATNFQGSAIRHAMLSAENLAGALAFNASFGDATVKLPEGFSIPCQWAKSSLSDAEYFGRLRGWIETALVMGVTDDLRSYPAILPEPACLPKYATSNPSP
jgi:uncharacterized protein YjbI with pentapeptide repeats